MLHVARSSFLILLFIFSCSVTKEVVFQRVKKEVVRRFKSGKGSKRDAWRNSRPIKKGVPAPGGRHSKVTLLEMVSVGDVLWFYFTF